MRLGTKLFFATMTVIVAGAVTYRIVHGASRVRGPRLLRGSKGLGRVYEEGATASDSLLARIHPEIDADALVGKVIDLSEKAQDQAYTISERIWLAKFEGDKDDLVAHVLKNIAPNTSWHVPREELPDGDPRARVMDGVSWIVEVMGASAEEQARSSEKTAEGGVT